jgi:cytochrome c oxidase assembly factor CtaG
MLPHEAVHMAGMGALVSLLAPALVLATRHRFRWSPGWGALPAFVALHAALMLWMDVREPVLPVHLVLETLLVAGAVLFWLPVLGAGRLDDTARCVYLFLATPSLDLPAVVIVARGHAAGGLSMIVAMLPIGLAAVVLTWRYLLAEERSVQEFEKSLVLEVPYADS